MLANKTTDDPSHFGSRKTIELEVYERSLETATVTTDNLMTQRDQGQQVDAKTYT